MRVAIGSWNIHAPSPRSYHFSTLQAFLVFLAFVFITRSYIVGRPDDLRRLYNLRTLFSFIHSIHTSRLGAGIDRTHSLFVKGSCISSLITVWQKIFGSLLARNHRLR